MALSFQRRWEIIFLHNHEHGPKWSQNRIAKYLNIIIHTVKKWLDIYKETGDIKDKEGRGHSKITSPKEDKLIISLFQKDEYKSLGRAKYILSKRGIEVSKDTISRRLKEGI